MNKHITEQTDSLESIISEVTKLNELVYAGWSVESLSRDVTTDNIEDICALLNRLTQSTDKGRQAALSRGVRFGAPKKLDTNQVEEMREKRKAGVLIKDLMREYGLSKASVYRLMAS